jgi:tetratricopeptide (TPR) repeat protein
MAARASVGSGIALAVCLSVLGSDKKPNDQCAPEPGATAPALPARLMTGMGTVHFPITTTSGEAQRFFDQGVAQMHSFWAREAERSFLQAAALDPKAPMPWWGVAMVAAGDYRPGFQLGFVNGAPEDRRNDRVIPVKKLGHEQRRAFEAAQRALALSEGDTRITDMEKLYIRSIAARRGIGSTNPNREYVEGLRRVVAASTNDIEAQTFLALAVMSGFTTPERKPRSGSMEAIAILKRLLPVAPDHPGVQHYVIHGWEGSSFAQEAWPSCEKYPKLAPMIPHALHMPGHIYAQTGRWEDAEQAFTAAAELERRYISDDSLYGTGHHGHNVHFLIATYMFQRDYDRGMTAARELMAIPETPAQRKNIDDWYAADRQGWFGMMRTLVYSSRWDEILDKTVFTPPLLTLPDVRDR